jgi:dihydrofolate reductase
MTTSIIAAMTSDRIIGIDNTIPWKIKEEMLHFRNMTVEHPVIMGRKTYESIGKPLPKRTNIVLTRGAAIPEVICRPNIITAIRIAEMYHDEVFIIGGSSIYEQSLNMDLVDKMYLSIIKEDYDGDAKFPKYDSGKWKLESEVDHDEFVVKTLNRRK